VTTAIVLDCDPGLDDTIAIPLALASRFCDGRTVVDLGNVTGRPANAHVGVDVDSERFLELLCSRIERLG
jgi:inosine-uridine nucleoside N-ribohydrolase